MCLCVCSGDRLGRGGERDTLVCVCVYLHVCVCVSHTHKHTHTSSLSLSPSYAHTHTHNLVSIHTRTLTHAHTHTETHTHTHILLYSGASNLRYQELFFISRTYINRSVACSDVLGVTINQKCIAARKIFERAGS